ncbi:MAG: phosphatidylglycerophosphatase A [Elusimicrobia bacterium]|nr:phosphatidylglycerophosphatase A [Elusimicrobiota bacterium]
MRFFEWARGRRWTGAGLLGTFAGLILAPLLPTAPVSFGLFWAGAAGAACWLCGRAEKVFGVHDDPRIVLDEVVGFWTAIAFLPPRLPVWMAAFILFRALDACKLPPWVWLERLPGGLGVVADDVGAGVATNIVLRVLIWLVPWFGL